MRDDTDNKQSSRCKYRDCSGEKNTQWMTIFFVKLISIFTELLTPKYKYIGKLLNMFYKSCIVL